VQAVQVLITVTALFIKFDYRVLNQHHVSKLSTPLEHVILKLFLVL